MTIAFVVPITVLVPSQVRFDRYIPQRARGPPEFVWTAISVKGSRLLAVDYIHNLLLAPAHPSRITFLVLPYRPLGKTHRPRPNAPGAPPPNRLGRTSSYRTWPLYGAARVLTVSRSKTAPRPAVPVVQRLCAPLDPQGRRRVYVGEASIQSAREGPFVVSRRPSTGSPEVPPNEEPARPFAGGSETPRSWALIPPRPPTNPAGPPSARPRLRAGPRFVGSGTGTYPPAGSRRARALQRRGSPDLRAPAKARLW